MSNDGMASYAGDETLAERLRNNELQDDEEEDLVLDRAVDYKMVSIMKQARPTINNDPYQQREDQTKLS